MGPTGEGYNVLQVHPSRRCNLRCRHCYSLSGPEEREALAVDILSGALSDAAADGFNVAGFSGGEPLMYEGLPALLAHARRCGMATTVTTNGMLVTERVLDAIKDSVTLLAISLDGVPESHDRVRASNVAFERMQRALPAVRRSGIPFGFIFTLTQFNVHEVEWVAEFAVREGARLLQIHPLEVTGRATSQMNDAAPDAREAGFAFLVAARIRELVGDRLQVQLDVTSREALRQEPGRAFADEAADPRAPFAEFVSPLIIESDGTVVPLQYGFARAYMLGNLHAAPLRDLMAAWRGSTGMAFRRLCAELFEDCTRPSTLPHFNWYEAVARAAAGSPPVPASS